MSGIEKSINANITDIINHANNVTLDSIYHLNQDFYEGYQWISALDSKTCLACAALDNKIFRSLPHYELFQSEKSGSKNVIDGAPPAEPPLHPFCRCFMIPVLDGMADEPSQTQFNYQDWFEEQDRNTQIDILGPARYLEYKNGMIVTSFAKDGRIMSLKELEIDRITLQKLYEELYKKSKKTVRFSKKCR